MNTSAPTATPAAREPSAARLVLTLSFAGLLSGLAIVGAYETTLPTITANQAEALRQAVLRVLPGAATMQKLSLRGDTLAVASTGDEEAPFVHGGYDAQGRFVGYAVAAEGAGFQDTIRLIYGYDPRGRRVVGMWVLESRETPGLGDKIYKDAEFVANFRSLAVDPEIAVVKKGLKKKANQVDAITGATISSKAVVRIINEGNRIWFTRFPAPGSEPPFTAPSTDRGPP